MDKVQGFFLTSTRNDKFKESLLRLPSSQQVIVSPVQSPSWANCPPMRYQDCSSRRDPSLWPVNEVWNKESPWEPSVTTRSSLVQKLASRFIEHTELQAESTYKTSKETTSKHFQFSKLQSSNDKQEINRKQSSTKCDAPNKSSILILLWLLGHRDVLKVVSDLRLATSKEHGLLLQSHELTYSQVVGIGRNLQNLCNQLKILEQKNKSDFILLKRLVLLTSAIQVAILFTVVWFGKPTLLKNGTFIFYHFKKSVLRPFWAATEDMRRISISLFSIVKFSLLSTFLRMC